MPLSVGGGENLRPGSLDAPLEESEERESPEPERELAPARPEPPIYQKQAAEQMAANLIKRAQDEKREQLISSGRKSHGLLFGWLLTNRIRQKVDAEKAYMLDESHRQLVNDYCLQLVTGQARTASSDEVFRLMNDLGYERDAQGFLNPGLQDTTWYGRMLRVDNTKPTALIGGAGVAIGAGASAGLGAAIGSILGFAGGALGGGIFGWLRGRREGEETTMSGESWIKELDGALSSGNKAEIQAACHKVERIIRDPQARQEFFRDRPRVEGIWLLTRYQEGIRRLAMARMAESVAQEEGAQMTGQERQSVIAERYTDYCRDMARGEDRFMRLYGDTYGGALAREVNIISWDQETGATGRAATQDRQTREEVLTSFQRTAQDRRRERRWIVARHVIQGALTGGIFGAGGMALGALYPGSALLSGGFLGLTGWSADTIARGRHLGISSDIMGRYSRDWTEDTGPFGSIVPDESKKKEEEKKQEELKKTRLSEEWDELDVSRRTLEREFADERGSLRVEGLMERSEVEQMLEGLSEGSVEDQIKAVAERLEQRRVAAGFKITEYEKKGADERNQLYLDWDAARATELITAWRDLWAKRETMRRLKSRQRELDVELNELGVVKKRGQQDAPRERTQQGNRSNRSARSRQEQPARSGEQQRRQSRQNPDGGNRD